MVALQIKNLKEVPGEAQRQEIQQLAEKLQQKFEEWFKRYTKPLTFEVIVAHNGRVFRISAALDMKSKKVLHAEEDIDPVVAAHKLFEQFRRHVKRQIELERKDYEYKRKNRKKR